MKQYAMVEITLMTDRVVTMCLSDGDHPFTWDPRHVTGLMFRYRRGRRIVFPWCNILSYEVIPAGSLSPETSNGGSDSGN
jgi:hypothetical protein